MIYIKEHLPNNLRLSKLTKRMATSGTNFLSVDYECVCFFPTNFGEIPTAENAGHDILYVLVLI